MAGTATWAALASGRAAQSPTMPFVDGLTFLSETDQDVPESGLSAFICDVSSAERVDTADGSLRWIRTFDACWQSLLSMRKRVERSPHLVIATKGSQIPQFHRNGQSGVFFQFQGCEPLDGRVERIELFYELGLRVLQITHHNDNPFGGGAIEREWTGLTELGRQAVEKMNEIGVIVDLSHSSDLTGRDVLAASRRPVIISHGAARTLVNNARCTPDDIIRGVAESGGVMGIFMMSFWLTEEPIPSIQSFLRQIRHVVRVGGIESVGIANDYSVAGQAEIAKLGNDNNEGIKGYLPWWDSVAKQGVLGFDRAPRHAVIPELNNVRRMFLIREALEKEGFTATETEKIMGGNWIRVLTESLG